MSGKTSLHEELLAINEGLRDSYERLSALLEKNRNALKGPESRSDKLARENIAAAVRKLEAKLEELKELGAADV